MVTKKVKKIIRKKLYEYPIYDRLINELELEKDTTEGRDINSSIRSKNKISRGTEGQAIKNISIDVKINILQITPYCTFRNIQFIRNNIFRNITKKFIFNYF